jgi:hypothetical protein
MSAVPDATDPSTSLYRLVYASLTSQHHDDASMTQLLADILNTSRERNAQGGVTGVLLADERMFVQCLEGPRDAVFEVWYRIQDDPRHQCLVELLHEENADARLYPDWSMGFTDATREELLRVVRHARDKAQHEPENMPWAGAMDLLLAVLSKDTSTALAS